MEKLIQNAKSHPMTLIFTFLMDYQFSVIKFYLIFTIFVIIASVLVKFLILPRAGAKKRKTLLEMDIEKPNAQWAIICSDDQKFLQACINELKPGGLRILIVHVIDQIPEIQGFDKAILLRNLKEIDEFLAIRHAKIFINGISQCEDIGASQKASVIKLLDMVFKNMQKYHEGCIVNVEMNEEKWNEYNSFCKNLSQNAEKGIFFKDEGLRKGRKGIINAVVKDFIREISELPVYCFIFLHIVF